MKYPRPIQKLIDLMSRLPSVGPKTAERYVFYLLRARPEYLADLSKAMADLQTSTTRCHICHSLTEADPCPICSDKNRDQKVLCLVADSRELAVIEDSAEFPGRYHVLGGLIDTVNKIGPDQLNVKSLIARVKQEKPKEIIMAFSPTVEGETTAMYLAKLFQPANIRITRLSRGLPNGANIEYADQSTISNALKYRNDLK